MGRRKPKKQQPTDLILEWDEGERYHVGIPRRPSAEEWEVLSSIRPSLVAAQDRIWFTGGFNETFNCIGYALEQHEFIEPPSIGEFEEQVRSMEGEYRALDDPSEWHLGDIAVTAKDSHERDYVTHAMVRYYGMTVKGMEKGLWESKDGALQRYTHGLHDFDGTNDFGDVVRVWTRTC